MKQTVAINFSQGLNTKVDPWQIPAGQFSNLVNSVFTKGGLLAKRPGYAPLDLQTGSYLTTFNGNLVSIGTTVNAYSSSLEKSVSKGTLQPCSIDTLPLIRNNLNQTQVDTAIANGLILTVYSQINNSTTTYFYAIADVVTGQNIVQPTSIPALGSPGIVGSSRSFVVGNYFVIVSDVEISSTHFLQYVSIPVANPSLISSPQNVTADNYVPISSNPGWDGVVANNTLVVAYNSTTGGQGVHVASLTQAQVATNSATTVIHSFTGATNVGALMSVCVDTTTGTNPNIFYINFWRSSTSNGYTAAVYLGFGTITVLFTPQQSITGTAVNNLASAAQNGVCSLFYSTTTHIHLVFITSAGSIGIDYVVIRGVGLASKAFIVDGTIYILSAFSTTFQPSFFLINGSVSTSANPVIVAKLAYENGGGLLALGLPSVTVTGNVAQMGYLIKDLVEALNTLNNSQQTTAGGIYSQTGINLVSFTLGTEVIDTAELGQALNISGGFLSMFDGYLPVEQNFFVWPEAITVTSSSSGGSLRAQTYFYQVTYEWSDNQGNIHRSAPSIPNGDGVGVTTTGAASSITITVPTLRLTMKTANPVKIVIYRWSTRNQVYNQITSITAPILNDTTVDAITPYVDTQDDDAYVGNNIIYTTGGVAENVNGPSCDIMTVFDTRIWLVTSENRNLLLVSKQVVENTPVEMSDQFTIYVAPNTGTVATTGPMRALFPLDDKICIFKDNSIFYINGVGPNNLGTTSPGCSLGNYSQPTFITSIVGCTNQRSIVLTQDGLMFQSDKGIYLLSRGLQVSYIGAPVERFNSSVVTSANVIPETTYVLFTLSTGEMLMYDYFYGQWGVFSGAPTISSCIYNGLHTILSPYGQILQSTPHLYVDGSTPVLMSFTTSWLNVASLQGYERIYEFYMLARYLSPCFVLAQVAYDYGDSIQHQVLISPHQIGSAEPAPFGDPTPWGGPPSKFQRRIHAKKQLCESFQLTMTEVFDASQGTIAGPGFTMSGLTMTVELKKSTRPISGMKTVGMD